MRVGRKDLKIVSSCQLVIFRDFYVQFKMVLYYFNFLLFLMGIMLLYILEARRMFLKIISPQLGTVCLFFSLSPQLSISNLQWDLIHLSQRV